jgi:hypothetical protein
VAPAAVARDDVVQRQVAGADAAVLAGMVIANENLAPRQPHARPWALDHVHEPNDRWTLEKPVRRTNGMIGVLENLCLAAVHQD